MPRRVIAGIDPGSTAGVAVLDLSGNVLLLQSTDGGIGETVRLIERTGTPSLIACDVNPPPEAVLRIASFFSCRAFRPEREIREQEKREIARGVGARNNHERDAYCSAAMGLRANANKLRQIDSREDLPGWMKDEVKHLVLKGCRMQDALLVLSPERKRAGGEWEKAKAPKPRSEARPVSPEDYAERIASLVRENSNLRALAERLEWEKRGLEERVRRLESGARQMLLRDSEIRKLRFGLRMAEEKLGKARRRADKGRLEPAAGGKCIARMPDLNALSGGRDSDAAKPAAEGRKKAKSPESDDLNSLGEPKLDLEKLVREYRKGRENA